MYRQIPKNCFRDVLNAFEHTDFENLPYDRKLTGSAKNKAYEILDEKISESILDPNNGIDASAIFYMCKILETATYLGTAPDDAGRLLRRIQDMTRNSGAKLCEPFSNTEAWKNAFACARSAEIVTDYKSHSSTFSRESVHANALLFLKKRDFDYALFTSGFGLTPRNLSTACKAVERRVKKIGGITTINRMLDFMTRCGKFHDGMFLHARLTQTTMVVPRPPNVPWKFIYGLSIKHFKGTARQIPLDDILQKMGDLSRNIGASFNVEPYSSYENMSVEHASWLTTTYDTLRYDELFALPQWQPNAADFIIPSFSTHLQKLLTNCGLAMPFGGNEAWNLIASEVIGRADLEKLTPLKKTIEIAPLKALIGNASRLNQKFRTPFQNSERAEFSFPLIAENTGDVWVHPKSIASRSFMECTFSALRADFGAIGKDFDHEIGPILDEVTVEVLNHFEHRVTVLNEHYSVEKGNRIEADIVVETEKSIFFFECTKKSLTNAARRGDLKSYIQDFDGSFLKNARQLLRHEANLKERGRLQFENGYTLELNDREVEKVAVNIFDHGSLQNLMTTAPLLRMLCSSKFEHSDPEMKTTCDSINKKIAGIKDSIEKICELSDHQERAFVSVASAPQITPLWTSCWMFTVALRATEGK